MKGGVCGERGCGEGGVVKETCSQEVMKGVYGRHPQTQRQTPIDPEADTALRPEGDTPEPRDRLPETQRQTLPGTDGQ